MRYSGAVLRVAIVPPDLLTQAPDRPPASDTRAETANRLLDGLVEASQRLLEMPLLALLGVIAALAALGAWWLHRRSRRGRSVRALRWILVGCVITGCVVVVDRKIAVLQDGVANLRAQTRASITALLRATGKQAPKRQTWLFDRARAEERLTQRFGRVETTALLCDEATDVVELAIADPPLAALLAIVDLRCPSLAIVIGDSLAEKTMTSTFARRHDCTVAINGEAGNSGRPGCGLGPWQGYLVQRGTCLLREQPDNPRPFLCFDAQNHATFTAAAATARELPPDAWNAIWGRVDLLVGGEVDAREFRNRQPRTAMAIDAAGSRLFLLVVDGRQERSWGMTRPEAGDLLAAFGAHDGMLCDEGGSTCMYLKVFGGIGNVPSDKLGEERPTYTHFGTAVVDDR